MNTEKATNGTEVYTSRLYQLADEYIDQELDGDEEKVNAKFRDMVFYLADRLPKIPNEEIEELDAMFSAFTRLCTKYARLPTLEAFSWLVGIDRNTFTDWKEARYRLSSSHGSTVKKWLEVCKGFVVDELSNSKFANPNLIFTAKASYGLRETSPIPAEPQAQITTRTPEEIAAAYGAMAITENMELPEVPD